MGDTNQNQSDSRKGKRAWKDARTFQDLCELMARCIEGTLDFCPTGLDDESDEIASELAAINRAGFLTTGSQPGYAVATQ